MKLFFILYVTFEVLFHTEVCLAYPETPAAVRVETKTEWIYLPPVDQETSAVFSQILFTRYNPVPSRQILAKPLNRFLLIISKDPFKIELLF